MKTSEDLRKLLLSIDHRGYPAYKDARGKWSFGNYILSIDHVQGDPFASPSNVSILVPGRTACFPADYYSGKAHRRIALQDTVLRFFARALSDRDKEHQRAGSGKSGMLSSSRPGQEVLERTACQVNPLTGDLALRFEIGFPANGRTINVRPLISILYDFLPSAVSSCLMYRSYDSRKKEKLQDSINLSDDQAWIRTHLSGLGLAAFVADGSVLPRQSGVSPLPMKNAVPFTSPAEMAVTLDLPHRGPVRGMGIRRGVTLIVGGGYHGKSTLLKALEQGVYDHIRGDGREYVITDQSAVKVRAEDGRSIIGTDISLFIRDLPSGKDTVHFTTEDASGSTSQAANVVEAMEAGTRLLLIDEDTSATNFMVRDELMARVVLKEQEPITPFFCRVRDLYEKAGISTILVAGSSGAFFHVADSVIQMDNYIPREITNLAKKAANAAAGISASESSAFSGIAGASKHSASSGIAGASESSASSGIAGASEHSASSGIAGASEHSDTSGAYRAEDFLMPAFTRIPRPDRELLRDNRIKLKVLARDSFLIARNEVELRGLEQITDREQTAALAHLLRYMELHMIDGKRSFREVIDRTWELISEKGLEELFDGGTVRNGLAQVRREEIAGMLSRYRKL